MPGGLKPRARLRDRRRAVRWPTAEPAPDGTSWAGEAKLAGRAVPEPSEDGSHRFRVDLAELVLTRLGEPADHLVIESWHEGRGPDRIERR